MLGNNVVLTPKPLGRYWDGVANQSGMYPGTGLSVVPSGGIDAGKRLTWGPWSQSTGAQGLIAIGDFNGNEGFPYNVAYPSGKRFPIYIPVCGDELNMLLAELAGTTGDPAITLGEILILQTGTGMLVPAATGTAGGTQHQFMAMEALTAALGQEWTHVVKIA
jgi:hypothetical protein